MAQNAVEKRTLQHLLECVVHDLGSQEAAESGITKGLVGVDKEMMKYGLVQRRAKTAYKKDERFLVAVPGKLLLFKGMDIVGKHVRFVTSLYGASTRLVYGQLEFEVMVPDSKSLNLLTLSAEELTGWIGAIGKASLLANEGAEESGRQNSQVAGADERRDLAYRNPGYAGRRKSESSAGDSRREYSEAATQGFYTNRSKTYDGRDQRRGNREYQNREEEKYQGNQVHGGYAGGRVDARGFEEKVRPDNDGGAMDDYEFTQINESKMQLPRQHEDHRGRERDQSKLVLNGRQDVRIINTVSKNQEMPLPPGTSTLPILPPGKDYPLQQPMYHSQPDMRYLDNQRIGLGSREGQGYGAIDPSQGHEERNAGKGVMYYAQAEFDRGNADRGNLRRESSSWDRNYGPPVQSRSAKEECRIRKSAMQSVSVPGLSNQQLLPTCANLQEPPPHWISENRRGSMEELDKMAFYMKMYRRGLVESSTQT